MKCIEKARFIHVHFNQRPPAPLHLKILTSFFFFKETVNPLIDNKELNTVTAFSIVLENVIYLGTQMKANAKEITPRSQCQFKN